MSVTNKLCRDSWMSKKEKLSRFTDSIFGWDHDDDGNMIPNWEEQSIITAMKAMTTTGASLD